MPAPSPDHALAVEQQVSFALSSAARNVAAIYRPLLATVGLTHPQYLVMLVLWQHGPLSVSGLGHRLQLDSGTLSPLLKRLESLGYVRRERDSADARSVTVTLTAEGDALRTRAAPIAAAVHEHLGMSVEDLQRLLTVLAGVSAAARGPRSSPAGP